MIGKYRFFLILFIFTILINLTFGRSYPLKYIAKPGCKFEIRKNLSSDCKILLPRIKNADYKKYKDNLKYRLIYSVLWTATYKNGWDIGYGSHEGVDIPSSLGTPVYSIGNGKVIIAGYLKGWGNTVVIQHYIGNGKYIRSVYAHLNKIFVKKGQSVKEGEKIGEIGHSGNAWGNHLHFQIDTNQHGFHPYYPLHCGNPYTMVNKGLCKEKIISNTIDPIYFLETNGANLIKNLHNNKIQEITKQIVEKEKISPKTIIPREKLRLTELELFLARYKINIKSLIPANVLYINKNGSIEIKIYKKNGKPFKGMFPENIKISTLKGLARVFPNEISYMDNGKRLITIIPNKIGTDVIIIKVGKKVLKEIPIRIINKNYKIVPYHSLFWVQTNYPHIGDEIWGLTILQDKNYANIIKVPFIGTYTLKIENGLICPIKISKENINRINYITCTSEKLVNTYKFSYKDTFFGILIYKIIPTQLNNQIKIKIYNSKGKIIGYKTIFHKNKLPLDFKNRYSWINQNYKNFVEKSIKHLLVRNYKIGKFVPNFNLKRKTAIDWIKNLKYLLTKKVDLIYKPELGSRYITRLEFLKLISENLKVYSKINKNIFWDTTSDMYKYTNILAEINGKFLDRFGNKFFQPKKLITRQEAAYILEKIYEYFIYKNKHSY